MGIDIIKILSEYGFTAKTFEQALQDINCKMSGLNDYDWSEIIQKYNLNISSDTARKGVSSAPFGSYYVQEFYKWKEQNKNKTYDNQDKISQYGISTTINKDGSFGSDKLIEMSENECKDKNFILKAHGFDISQFELISAKNSIWNVQVNGGDTKTLYSSKITVKPKPLELTDGDFSKWFDRLDREYSKPIIERQVPITDDCNKVLVLPISDLHYNLRASLLETGNEYNCEIAEKIYFGIIFDVLSRVKEYKFEKIIFTIGGDNANTDNIIGATHKNTMQDVQIGYFDMVERLYALTVKAIDILADIANVSVVLINSNHDTTVAYGLAHYIKAFFRNDKRIDVDISPLPRKYIQYGKTLFVFAHNGDIKKLPELVADEAREYWSQIEQTEIMLQHLHHEVVLKESNNMRIQRLPTMSGKSRWAVGEGYNSKRQCKSFIFDKEYGLTDVLYTNIKQIII